MRKYVDSYPSNVRPAECGAKTRQRGTALFNVAKKLSVIGTTGLVLFHQIMVLDKHEIESRKSRPRFPFSST
jgi:hypothetical protein